MGDDGGLECNHWPIVRQGIENLRADVDNGTVLMEKMEKGN
jgi:hypothetical protein